jgi:1-pyrroline-5-carboxylate dehydrogenase
MIDFWRFNARYTEELYATQPSEHSPGVWNRTQYRPLEGFVVAISPFNFAAIGANLPSAPAILGNTVVWKPSHTAVLANYVTYKILQEAGLPAGVINFIPGDGPILGRTAFSHPMFAGLHFTGSTSTFNTLWKQVCCLLFLVDHHNMDNSHADDRYIGSQQFG